jgi:hypothetical protein
MDVGSSWMLNDGRWSIGVVATTPPILEVSEKRREGEKENER